MNFAYKTPDALGIYQVVLDGTLPADPTRSTLAEWDLWPVDLSALDAPGVRQDFSVGTPRGWQLVDGVVVPCVVIAEPQVPYVPSSVTRRQLFLVLLGQGITRAMLRLQLAGNEAGLIELEEATEFRRDHALVASLATALGLTSEQVDALFIQAAAL